MGDVGLSCAICAQVIFTAPSSGDNLRTILDPDDIRLEKLSMCERTVEKDVYG